MDHYPSTLADHASSGQYSALRDFSERTERATQGSLNNFGSQTEQYETLLSKIALLQHKSALKILYVIYDAFPDRLLTVQIAERADIHRSTVSIHVKDLVELGFVTQDIRPGTETKYKPSFLFGLNSEIDRKVLHEIFESKSKSDPYLTVIHKEKTVPQENPIDSESSLFDVLEDSSPVPSETLVDQAPTTPPVSSFEEQIATLVTAMAQEIVFLQKRVSELEETINKKSQQRQQLDLSQAMSLLDLNKKKPQ